MHKIYFYESGLDIIGELGLYIPGKSTEAQPDATGKENVDVQFSKGTASNNAGAPLVAPNRRIKFSIPDQPAVSPVFHVRYMCWTNCQTDPVL